MLIAACQTPEIVGDVDAAVEVILGFAGQTDADLLVLPECFLQGYLVTAEHVRTQALEIGSPEFAAAGRCAGDAGGRQMPTTTRPSSLRAVWWWGGYRKTRLTAGESVFSAGADFPVFDCAGSRFGRLALGPTCVMSPEGEVVAHVPANATGMVTFRLP